MNERQQRALAAPCARADEDLQRFRAVYRVGRYLLSTILSVNR